MFGQNWRRVSTSWNFKNFDARSWRIRFPFALFSLHLWDGHSKRGIKTLAVTSCKIQNNCFWTLIQSFQIELRNRVKMLMYATSVQKIVYSTSLSGFIPNCSRIIYYRSSTYQGYNQKESLKRDQVPGISRNHILHMYKQQPASRASHPSSESQFQIFSQAAQCWMPSLALLGVESPLRMPWCKPHYNAKT